MTAGKFRGPRGYTLEGLPDDVLRTTVNDGIGTKVEIHDAAGSYKQAARDVIAMTGSDITRYGGYPLVFTSVLDVANIGEP
jgi:phosphoribosylaminoimidazole (AIR) synthetase